MGRARMAGDRCAHCSVSFTLKRAPRGRPRRWFVPQGDNKPALQSQMGSAYNMVLHEASQQLYTLADAENNAVREEQRRRCKGIQDAGDAPRPHRRRAPHNAWVWALARPNIVDCLVDAAAHARPPLMQVRRVSFAVSPPAVRNVAGRSDCWRDACMVVRNMFCAAGGEPSAVLRRLFLRRLLHAGNPSISYGYSGDGGQAIAAQLGFPIGLALTKACVQTARFMYSCARLISPHARPGAGGKCLVAYTFAQ
jgi:hypothetical protein